MKSLNKRIEIQSAIETLNENGGINTEYNTEYTLWANICPISAENSFELKRSEDKITHIITTRYLSNINTKMRILYKERVFIIKGIINPKEDCRFLEFNVEERL